MKNTKVLIVIMVVFVVLIIGEFLPALMTNNDGYKTKKITASEQQTATVTKELVAEKSPVNTNDVAVKEDPAPSEMLKDTVDKVTAPAEELVNEGVSEVKTMVETVKAAVEPATIAAPATDGLYSVVDGNKLDAHSYAGFKLYRNWCARCHGTYGQGMVGPNLADSLKLISKEEFYDTVENGKTGTIGSMPAWKANVQVMENRDQLYAYLMARSDGAIGEEKPKKQ